MARGCVDVSERRLRPIYDALDNGNNKKALQEADKALKKQKDLLCTKALRALALLRLNRVDECTQQLKEVHEQSPTDDATLQAMSISYREMHRLDLIVDMYEKAHERDAKNEEILSALFMGYVRVHNYKKQQQTAIKLHKLRPEKNPYYFWNIMSIVMQAHEDEKLAKSMFLPLAERMAEKYAKEERIEAEAEVNLYLLVLEQLGKHQKALEVLRGPLAEKLHSELDFVEVKAAEIMYRLEMWPEANQAYRKLLVKMPDQWQFYVKYFSTLFKLVDSSWEPTCSSLENSTSTDSGSQSALVSKDGEENTKANGDSAKEMDSKGSEQSEDTKDPIDYTVKQAFAFVQSQIDGVSELRTFRGPFLAKFELLKQLIERNKNEHLDLTTESTSELLAQYYARFGSKGCYFMDLKPYISLLEPAERHQLVQRFSDELYLQLDGDIVYPTDLKVMFQHLTVLKLRRFIGAHENTSIEEKMALVKDLYLRYQDGLRFGKGLTETDLQYSDDYIIMAAHILYDAYLQSEDQQYLWQACVLLEKALGQSHSNYQLKLLLMKLYCLLGAFGPCPSLYDSMEIKHIQNDSMAYTVTNHIARLGHISSATSLYETMLRSYAMNQKETTEYLVQSYKYGSFSKIIEFVKFRERLKNSFQYAHAKTERMLLNLTMETNSHEATEHMIAYMDIQPRESGMAELSIMTDNRDCTVMTNWEPDYNTFHNERIRQSKQEELAWIKLRDLTLRVIAAGVICAQTLAAALHQTQQSAPTGTGNDVMTNGGDISTAKKEASRQQLEEVVALLETHLGEVKTNYAEPVTYPLCGPSRTRISTYVTLGSGGLLQQLTTILLGVHKALDNRADTLDESLKKTSEQFISEFSGLVAKNSRDVISEAEDEEKNRLFNTDLLENLVCLTEFIGQACMVLGSCYRIVCVLKSGQVKPKGKKKRQPQPLKIGAMDELFTLCETLKSCLVDQSDNLTELFRRMDKTIINMETQKLKILSLDTPEQDALLKVNDSVKSRVLESYQISAREMLTFLHNKGEYLKHLEL